MTEIAKGRSSPLAGLSDEFRALTNKQWIAIIAGIFLAVILVVYMGLQCFGFLIAAIVLYMIPHMMGVSSVKIKALAGAIFFVIALLASTLVTSGSLADTENGISLQNDRVSDFSYTPEIVDENGQTTPDMMQFTIRLDNDTDHVLVQIGDVDGLSFNSYSYSHLLLFIQPGGEIDESRLSGVSHSISYDVSVTPLGDNRYSVTVSDLGLDDGIYVAVIGTVENTSNAFYQVLINEGNHSYMGLALENSLYITVITIIVFIVILVFSHLMRSSAQKTRKRMEAEGRLYPQGYGRCKECGAMVLPGEINCRKCGAYIDVPDELRVKKKDFFQCSECGAEVPSDATECPRCGAKFDSTENEVVHRDGTVDVSSEDVLCPDCGCAVPANADWCPRCGKMLKKQ